VAIGIHVARVGLFSVDPAGNIIKKNSPDLQIKQVLNSSMDHLVLEDATIPNTSGNPNVTEYLKLEAANDYVLSHINQTMVITYKRSAAGGYVAP